MTHGVFAKISARIRELRKQGKGIINAYKLAESVDVSDMPRDVLEQRYARAATYCALYEAGYRATFRGEGLFVDRQTCENPVLLARMMDNLKGDIEQKESAYQELFDITQKHAGVAGQNSISIDESTGNIIYHEGLSEEEMIALMRKAASY